MRKGNREVTDLKKIIKIIEKCDVCRLAMVDNGVPYIVAMNFGYTEENGTIVLYFHCANEGRKIDILKANPYVCAQMDCSHELVLGNTGCKCSMNYESFIGNGKAAFIENKGEKIFALSHIMKKYAGEGEYDFDGEIVDRTTVFRVVLGDYRAKRLKK